MSKGLRVSELDCGPLQSVAFEIAARECVGLCGPSGSGKTRLLRAIADLDPNRGELTVDGVPREAMSGPDWRCRVGFVPAESRWWAESVSAHFAAQSEARKHLDALGLEQDVWERDPAVLSSGERQRLSLLRASDNSPAVLLLDEPTSNLDEGSTDRVERWLAELQRAGTALLWVSHLPEQLARVCNRVLRIESGTLVELHACD